MKILGREPTLWLAVLTSLLMVVGTLGFNWFSVAQAGLLVVAINGIVGAINAYTTRPVSPAAFTYAIAAILAFAGSYGLNLPNETVAAINAVVVPILALLTRDQVSPQDTALSKA